VRRGDEARGLGEGGTEFKSGAILNERMTSTKPRKYRRGRRFLEMQNLRLLSLVYNRSFGEEGRRSVRVALDCETK
jgi:hypothetical protein